MTSLSPRAGTPDRSDDHPTAAEQPTGFARRQLLPLGLTAAAVLLLVLIGRTDRDQDLYKAASHRFRFHAIPVAIAQLYHHAPHDYTSYKHIAHRFQATDRDLQELIAEAIWLPPVEVPDIYYWVADDRGLSDYVYAAFRVYGPEVKSLTKFYFLILGGAVGLFAVGYWRTPAALVLPIGVLVGVLALAQVLKLRVETAAGGRVWLEEIALYESRMFDLLALVSWFHLAVLAAAPRAGRAAWLTAVPQAAILVFLYHARSSLGWQYLALFSLAGMRAAWWLWQRWQAADRPSAAVGLRPVFVAGLLAVSLVGLAQYKRATYNPVYFADGGPRTFWHNALMGYAYHPGLRQSLPMSTINDQEVAALVIRRLRDANDPRLDPTWDVGYMMNSLGGHCRFDWASYEQAAKEVYLGVWRDQPRAAAECYAWYKPLELANQGLVLLEVVRQEIGKPRARCLAPGLVAGALSLLMVFAAGRRNEEFRQGIRSAFLVALGLVPFSLIPGIAFYSAITTVSCFYAACVVLAGVGLVRVGWRSADWCARLMASSRPTPMVSAQPCEVA